MPHLLKFAILAAITSCSVQAAPPAPTKSNVKYDERHPRNVLDFYAAKKTEGNGAPILVWFHGGGFKKGDKSSIGKHARKMLEAYLDAGYAVASCNYPYLDKKGGIDYPDIARHCARAVRFIRSQATEWKIDPQRLCAAGISAGALISECLAYHDHLDSGLAANDPTKKFSSRPNLAISHLQPIGTRDFALVHMDKGEPPLFIYTNAPKTDRIHNPEEALKIRDKAKALEIPCVAIGGGRNALPKPTSGKSWLQMQLKFCETHLKLEQKSESDTP